MDQQLKKFLPKEGDKEGLVFIFHEFSIMEEAIPNKFKEIGTDKVRIEIAREVDNTLYSLGIFEAKVSKKGTEVTGKHKKQIMKILNECLVQFSKTDWRNNKGKKIEKEYPRLALNPDMLSTKGIYRNFGQLLKGVDIKNEGFEIIKKVNVIESNEKRYRFKVKENGVKSRKRVMFISDGEGYIYMHSSKYREDTNYFIRSKQLGRYIYFEDRYSDPIAGAAFGLAGSAASYTVGAMVLDTETGKVKFLNDLSLYYLAKAHPEIVKTYKESKRKAADKEKAIEQLNKTFQ